MFFLSATSVPDRTAFRCNVLDFLASQKRDNYARKSRGQHFRFRSLVQSCTLDWKCGTRTWFEEEALTEQCLLFHSIFEHIPFSWCSQWQAFQHFLTWLTGLASNRRLYHECCVRGHVTGSKGRESRQPWCHKIDAYPHATWLSNSRRHMRKQLLKRMTKRVVSGKFSSRKGERKAAVLFT